MQIHADMLYVWHGGIDGTWGGRGQLPVFKAHRTLSSLV